MLDRFISFYEPVEVRSASGMPTKTYQLITNPSNWAEVKWKSGNEGQEGRQRVAVTVCEMKIRYRSDLQQNFVILMEGKYYDILKILPMDRRQWLMLECEEKDNEFTIPT